MYTCGGVGRGQGRGQRGLTSRREGKQVGLVVGALWMGTWSCAESKDGEGGEGVLRRGERLETAIQERERQCT